MRRRISWYFSATTLVVLATACRNIQSRGDLGVRQAATMPATPLVLGLEQGERRVRRAQTSGLSSSFILKVDGRNGGSSDLVMGYEDVPPGQAIAPHQHERADEIIFVQRGSGVVELGTRTIAFTTGATIYLPKQVRIAVRNTGAEPLSIAFMFSKPGFEEYLRDTSVPEGEPVLPLSVDERTAIRARHRWHTVYDQAQHSRRVRLRTYARRASCSKPARASVVCAGPPARVPSFSRSIVRTVGRLTS